MNIEKAKAIGGWMSELELEWLATQASKYSVIVEIGAFIGRSTRALGDNTSGRVFTIDKWLPYEKEEKFSDGGLPLKLLDYDQIRLFRENMNGLLFKKVIPIMCDHRDLSWWNISPDMVFIDGGHNRMDVEADIDFWLPKILLGGLICGHDFDSSWPGVVGAVMNGLPSFDVVPGTTIWWHTV